MASIALVRAYQQSFESHPYGTLAFTNGALNALGDVVAQTVQISDHLRQPHEIRPDFDFLRTARFFAFGFGIGPLIGRWNFFLERHFPLRFIGGNKSGKVSLRALSKRVAADQLVMAPIGLTLFLGSMGIMEGRDGNHIKEKFKDLYAPLITANWQLINFRYMPLAYRVPFQSTCGVFWTLYLSMQNSREASKQDYSDAMQRTLRNE
ncbi:hypothetical protein EUX98_g7536 [Antrodiella citrinella]|uniref:Protein sym1 n=1 Tax=Antrodiella citrinella TaxID=2447956 RepID=A0A4S4MN01_9APHY|nr:hypothetical protein EUX98_g7536 [Antrodiella citrinella]